MSTRRRLTITLDGRVAVVRGWGAADLIKAAGGKPIYAGTVGGWMVDAQRVGDLIAYLEQRNIAITMVGADPRRGEDQLDAGVVDIEAGGLW